MELTIQNKILDINREFYDQFASSFSATRHRVQPGVHKLIPRMMTGEAILDVGCGNGTLTRALAGKGYRGNYLGIDMSQDLLVSAEKLFETPDQGTFRFLPVDLAKTDWHKNLPEQPFEWLVSFAVLHHLPGEELRRQTVRAFASLVANNSFVAVSVWQWQNSSRLRKRVLPWSTVDLEQEALDKGDVLLDWRAGETTGLRYVHTFSQDELTNLAKSAGFKMIENFYSDGKEGNLALYQIWQSA